MTSVETPPLVSQLDIPTPELTTVLTPREVLTMTPVTPPMPAPASDLLSLVTHLPTSISQLIIEKEEAVRRCAELERLVS